MNEIQIDDTIFLKVLADNIYSYYKRKSISNEEKIFCIYGYSLIKNYYLDNKNNLNIKNIYLKLKYKIMNYKY